MSSGFVFGSRRKGRDLTSAIGRPRTLYYRIDACLRPIRSMPGHHDRLAFRDDHRVLVLGGQVPGGADGWTLSGAPGNLSAQYEHTMIITKGEPIVVTRH